MVLPRYIVLKSKYNNKYLRYIHEDTQVHGFLQFSGDEVVSPYSKFEVEPSKTASGLVHLRCCYNNKYWVRWSKNHWWIICGADQHNENQSDWSCTLFQPIFIDGDSQKLRFLHVQLKHYCSLWRLDPPFGDCLFAGYDHPEEYECDICIIVDWESLLILPKHVAFKGDNGQYLSARWIEGHQYHQYASNDIGDPTVGYEIFTTNDGSVRVKSDYFGKFWRRSPNWIWADTTYTKDNNPDTLFWPVKVASNVVALRNFGNNYYCARLTTEGKTSCLNASVPTIPKEARMEVSELVISRQIYNVNFRLLDARVYGEKVITMANGVAVNKTNQSDEVEITLTYSDTTSKTWNSSVSLKLGVTTAIKTGIPIIAEGNIEISADFEGSYEWGETKETKQEIQTVYKATVPPMTTVRVMLLATVGTCDVPFSYSQRDTLTNGEQTTYYLDDGLYTGINSFNFKYEIKEEKL
ncbi:uncharacterized protein LOC110826025 [Carica papaya]|uniref:uncharacterized protein LOC110826025 n=1 Tax=Carica papaya TaxID=3649 RepID=UPI000B8D15B2|nr:uncharacterized protein LOC110826025 [Carica papaya]